MLHFIIMYSVLYLYVNFVHKVTIILVQNCFVSFISVKFFFVVVFFFLIVFVVCSKI